MFLLKLVDLFFFVVEEEDFDEKPGECPKTESPEGGECPPSPNDGEAVCVTDGQCPGDMKCCSIDGCTLSCVPAVLPNSPFVITGEPGDPGPPGDPVSVMEYFHVKVNPSRFLLDMKQIWNLN